MLFNFSETEIAEADFKLFDIFEHDEYIYIETSLGMFRRITEWDAEWEVYVALRLYVTRDDFIANGWTETDYNI